MPGLMISAAHKSSGKTVVTTGLAAALTARGDPVQCFKKGPDYIDPMWLGMASGRPCYNLDFNTMGQAELAAFHASRARDLTLIEANKGLYDGVATDGSDSNAELAKLLDVPVVLVVDSNGTTRGVAPLLLGYQAFDRDIRIAGVILNMVGSPRHEGKLRAAVEGYTDIPVLGAVPKTERLIIGERHLGLTTPAETGEVAAMIADFAKVVGASVDLDRIQAIAATTGPLAAPMPPAAPRRGDRVRIAIARDTAFGFYYPDDLEAFAEAGADLVAFDALKDRHLPEADGLFIGGGFPETQMQALAANTTLLADIRQAVQGGLPTYAECGGLMYLCQRLIWNDASVAMAGVIPGDAVMQARPEGRGYARFTRTPDHPWERGEEPVNAHEFHYAKVVGLPEGTRFARRVTRGAGVNGASDGVVMHNMIAGFCHLRNTAANPWVREFVGFVRAHKAARRDAG
ncbi:MAG: cobyrinate a,c-diamide synthase [Rhodobacteraceae bacterium]|nr:cobyrinate a,c-diamide synthase [Paracoccaceae bacterium]